MPEAIPLQRHNEQPIVSVQISGNPIIYGFRSHIGLNDVNGFKRPTPNAGGRLCNGIANLFVILSRTVQVVRNKIVHKRQSLQTVAICIEL